jgi:hypothetical protein
MPREVMTAVLAELPKGTRMLAVGWESFDRRDKKEQVAEQREAHGCNEASECECYSEVLGVNLPPLVPTRLFHPAGLDGMPPQPTAAVQPPMPLFSCVQI